MLQNILLQEFIWFFNIMRIRLFPLHNKNKRYVIDLLFSELSSDITNYWVFYWKIAIYSNLSKQVQKLCFSYLYCCWAATNISIKHTMSLICKILHFEKVWASKYHENRVKIWKKILICSSSSPPPPNSVPRISLFLFSNTRIRVFPLQNK